MATAANNIPTKAIRFVIECMLRSVAIATPSANDRVCGSVVVVNSFWVFGPVFRRGDTAQEQSHARAPAISRGMEQSYVRDVRCPHRPKPIDSPGGVTGRRMTNMPEFNANLWAPWRMEYIRSLGPDVSDDGCFLCQYWASPEQDATNHVVWRSRSAFVLLNRFPYTNGHLLVAHSTHVADLTDLTPAELLEISTAVNGAVRVLREAIRPQGFNVGYNLGRCAGAGLPGHIHAHVVPRWEGDTNFMAVLGGTRVIPDALDAVWRDLRAAADRIGGAGLGSGGSIS